MTVSRISVTSVEVSFFRPIFCWNINQVYWSSLLWGIYARFAKKADSSQIILSLTPGKMVCTGAKSEKDSRLAARKFGTIVQKLGFPAKFRGQ